MIVVAHKVPRFPVRDPRQPGRHQAAHLARKLLSGRPVRSRFVDEFFCLEDVDAIPALLLIRILRKHGREWVELVDIPSEDRCDDYARDRACSDCDDEGNCQEPCDRFEEVSHDEWLRRVDFGMGGFATWLEEAKAEPAGLPAGLRNGLRKYPRGYLNRNFPFAEFPDPIPPYRLQDVLWEPDGWHGTHRVYLAFRVFLRLTNAEQHSLMEHHRGRGGLIQWTRNILHWLERCVDLPQRRLDVARNEFEAWRLTIEPATQGDTNG